MRLVSCSQTHPRRNGPGWAGDGMLLTHHGWECRKVVGKTPSTVEIGLPLERHIDFAGPPKRQSQSTVGPKRPFPSGQFPVGLASYATVRHEGSPGSAHGLFGSNH